MDSRIFSGIRSRYLLTSPFPFSPPSPPGRAVASVPLPRIDPFFFFLLSAAASLPSSRSSQLMILIIGPQGGGGGGPSSSSMQSRRSGTATYCTVLPVGLPDLISCSTWKWTQNDPLAPCKRTVLHSSHGARARGGGNPRALISVPFGHTYERDRERGRSGSGPID